MSFSPGKIVAGKYTIEETLGRTARGTTYAAITMPSREVALKVASVYVPEKQRPRLLEAIRKQNVTLERLPERILLRVIEAGIDEEGSLYVVSPRSPHPSLAQLVELCPLTPEEALKVMWRLARALDAVHEAGIAHLALKPTNIFVGPAPDYAMKLGDFSSDLMRRVVDDDDAGLWLAPEQIRDPSTAKAPADVYAAARIMFFALTGKELPRGRRPVEYSIEIGRTIPPGLDGPLLAGLDPVPEARFQSVTGLVEALGPASVPSIEVLDAPPPPIDVPPPPSGVLGPLLQFEEEAKKSMTPAPPPPSSAPRPAAPKHSEPELFSLPKSQPKMTPPEEMPVVASPSTPIDSTPALLEASSPAVAEGERESKRPPFWAQLTKLHVALGASALGAVGLLLIVVAIVGSRKQTKPPVAVATTVTTTEAPPPAPSSAPAPPPEVSVAADTPPPATAEPEPEPPPAPAETAASDTEAPPLGPNEAQIDVTCEPKCDFVMINGKNSTYPAPIRVVPGMHAVNPIKYGHAAPWQKVVVKAGETKSIEFTMLPVAPAPPPPAAKKPCGKFLKRCD